MRDSGTQTFTIFRDDSEATFVVKNGFSWPAFLFNLYWAISKRLWFLAFVILVLVFGGLLGFRALVQVAPAVAGVIALALELAGLSFLGLRANRWWSASLERKGFRPVETVTASSHAAATEVASAV